MALHPSYDVVRTSTLHYTSKPNLQMCPGRIVPRHVSEPYQHLCCQYHEVRISDSRRSTPDTCTRNCQAKVILENLIYSDIAIVTATFMTG